MADLFTVDRITYGHYTSKGSKFSSYIHPLHKVDKYRLVLNEYKRNNPKACHVCSAYSIKVNGRIDEYASDDGEPSGSSGQPILGVIKRNKLVNIGIFVIRVYGGVNLGISGLIKAYGTSASNSLVYAKIVQYMDIVELSIQSMYDNINIIDRFIKKYKIKVIDRNFGDNIVVKVHISKKVVSSFKNEIYEAGKGEIEIF